MNKFPNPANACKSDKEQCFVIKKKNSVGIGTPSIYFTILDPWNRGFFATSDPKRFSTLQEATQFKSSNKIEEGAIIKGYLDTTGFYEGDLPVL